MAVVLKTVVKVSYKTIEGSGKESKKAHVIKTSGQVYENCGTNKTVHCN